MSHNQTNSEDAKRPWYQFSLLSLLLVMLGIALILPIAMLEPMCVIWGIPFFACSLAGAHCGQGHFRRMLALGGIGGTVGLWVGLPLILLHDHNYSFLHLAETLRRNWDAMLVARAVFDSIGNFLMGAIVAAAVWGVQRLRAKVKARVVSVHRLTVYACAILLFVLNCLVYGLWLLSALGL